MLRCSKCKEMKPAEAFGDAPNQRGKRYYCRPCERKVARMNRRKRHPVPPPPDYKVFPEYWQDKTDFTNADMRRMKFAGRKMTNCIFRFADLRGADLRACNFAGSDFYGARLDGALCGHANFCKANLTMASLQRAELTWTLFLQAELFGVNWNEAKKHFTIFTEKEYKQYTSEQFRSRHS